MNEVIEYDIDRNTLSEAERNALDILASLPLDKLNVLKEKLEIDIPMMLSETVLKKFLGFCQGKKLNLSNQGVNDFKDEQIPGGNVGLLKGVIGPQTARLYFDILTAAPDLPADGSQPRQINSAGLNLVKEFEGFASRKFRRTGSLVPDGKVTAYIDPVGVPTIGFGHTRTVKASDVDIKTISLQEAEELLRKDLADFEAAVSHLITTKLNENEFSALVSFTFNVGSGALSDSTLKRRLNGNESRTSVASEFLRFNKGVVNGKLVVLPGLTRRREAERALFLDPV
jgi:GH24 family phage-related lysozyme (muramidase)